MNYKYSIETIRSALTHISAEPRDQWRDVGMGLHNEFGDSALATWDEWSQTASNYSAKAVQAAWRSFKPGGGITIGTVLFLAQRNGFKLNGQGGKPLDPVEMEKIRLECEERRRIAAEKDAREQDATATLAAEIYAAAAPATHDHDYLRRRGVGAAPGVRVGRWWQVGEDGTRYREKENCLLVPMYQARELRNVQAIFPEIDAEIERDKDYLRGGQKQGACFVIGKIEGAAVVGEGYATMQSIYEATGIAAVVAFDKGNLLTVAKLVREKKPDIRLILAADNDIRDSKPNYGLDAATDAARAVGGFVAVPELDGKKCDFNDLHRARGPEAVKAAIDAATKPVSDVPKDPSADERLASEAEIMHEPSAVESAGEEESGDWPQPQPLPDRLPPVAPFSLDLLPEGLRGWIADIAERVQCPPEFPAVAAIVALGSVIGRKIAVRPKARDDWEEFPNLWGVIIGSPGVLKTPSLMESLRPLRGLEATAKEAHEAELTAWRAGQEASKIRREAARSKARQAAIKGKEIDVASLVQKESDDEPQPRRYIVNDSSIEALGMVLQASPNGVLAYRDELIGLLKSLDREGMEGARAFYLSAYSGKEAHVYDRIGRGLNIRVDHVCVSMLGSIQPSVIGGYLRDAFENGGDDGLLSRFSLLVWPDVTGAWHNVDRWPDSDSRKRAHELFARMSELDPQLMGAEIEENRAPFLRFDPAALELFVQWRGDFEHKQRDSDAHPALVAHFAKYRKLVPALALIFHLAGQGGSQIGEDSLLRALGWAELLETHARRAYASVQQARTEAARALLAKISVGAVPNPLRPRDVYLKGWSGLSDPDAVRRAVAFLEELDYVRPEIMQTGGRSRTVYWINPKGRQ